MISGKGAWLLLATLPSKQEKHQVVAHGHGMLHGEQQEDHILMYVYMYTHMFSRVFIYMYVCNYAYIHIICVYVRIYTQIYVSDIDSIYLHVCAHDSTCVDRM